MEQPDVAEVHYRLAATEYDLGQYGPALEMFRACQAELERYACVACDSQR